MRKILNVILKIRNRCYVKWFGFLTSSASNKNYINDGSIIRELSDENVVYCTSPVMLNRKQYRNSFSTLNLENEEKK